MKAIVQFSGGKDSLASLIWSIKRYGLHNVNAVFCDTGWEHPLTYLHIKEVVEKLGVNLITLRNKKFNGMVGLAQYKKRFPSTKAKFCTEFLKVRPMIDYILDECNEHLIIVQGIRGDESASRAKMEKQCQYFKYYFQPYSFDKKGKPKMFSYRKKEIKEWLKSYDDTVERPIFDWTGTDVMAYILENGLRPNELYYLGMKRVGCMPCIMCNKQEIKSIIAYLPETIQKLRDAEKLVGSSFFPPSYIPKRYCSLENKEGKKYPSVDDVIRYVKDKDATMDAFKEDNKPHKCMSFYNICE